MKKLRIFSLLLVLTLLLCACAKQDNTVTPAPGEQPDATVQPTPSEPDVTPDTPDTPDVQPSEPETPDTPDEQPADTPDDAESEVPKTEAPVIEPFTAEWTNKTERTDDTVVIDPDGIIIRLTAQLPQKDVRIERVSLLAVCGDTYDSTYETYDVTETLHTVETMAEGETLEIQINVPDTQPELAVSWEDAFGERDYRLILPQKIYQSGNASQNVELLPYREKIRPVEITKDLDLTEPYTGKLTKADNYTGTTHYGLDVKQTDIVTEYHYDIDGNGRKNSIQLLKITDEADQVFYSIRIICGDVFYDADQTVAGRPSLWMADLDEDGCAEVYFSGDVASDDFCTYGWRLGENALNVVLFCGNIRTGEFTKPTPGIDGQIVSIANQILTLETYTHRLGSHYVTQEYTAERDGMLSPMPGRDWLCTDGKVLTLKKALPVTVDGKQTTLPSGTKLTVTAMDAGNQVYFRTTGGVDGSIQLEENTNESDWCFWRIDGIKDEDYFESLPYVG